MERASAFLEAILKRAPKDYHAHQLPPVDDVYAERMVGLLESADAKHLPVLDYLIEIRCPLGAPGGSDWACGK